MDTKIFIFGRTLSRIEFKLAALCFAIFFITQTSVAQKKWSFGFRPGVDFATKDLGDADIGIGVGFEGVLAYEFMRHLSAYAGWSWNVFYDDPSFARSDMDFKETGYTYGLQFIHPIGRSNIDFMVRAGGLQNHIEVENSYGDIIADSGHGFGWQVGGGIVIPFGEKWSLLPSIRYHTLSRDLEIETVKTNVDLNYISSGVSFRMLF